MDELINTVVGLQLPGNSLRTVWPARPVPRNYPGRTLP